MSELRGSKPRAGELPAHDGQASHPRELARRQRPRSLLRWLDPSQRAIASRSEPSARVRVALGLLGLVAAVGAWQALTSLGVLNPIIYSSPARIVSAAGSLTAAGTLGEAVLSSAQLFALGFGLSLVSGLVIGLILGWYRRVAALLDPWVAILYASPRLAFIPIIVVLAGISLEGRLLVVWLTGVFPIIINTAAGVRAIDRQHLAVARSFLATNTFVLLRVAVPGAMPAIIAGIQNGMMLSLVGVVVAEYLIGGTGVGGLIFNAGEDLNTSEAFVGALIFAVAALVLSAALRIVERRLSPWRFN